MPKPKKEFVPFNEVIRSEVVPYEKPPKARKKCLSSNIHGKTLRQESGNVIVSFPNESISSAYYLVELNLRRLRGTTMFQKSVW